MLYKGVICSKQQLPDHGLKVEIHHRSNLVVVITHFLCHFKANDVVFKAIYNKTQLLKCQLFLYNGKCVNDALRHKMSF